MSQPAKTMPEPKYRTTKKREQPVTSIRSSEFAQEMKALKPSRKESEANIHLVGTEAEAAPAAKAKSEVKTALKLTKFWPVGVGLFLSGFAPEWHSIAAQAGIWVMRFTFPYAMLATHREIGIDAQMAGFLPDLAIFAQLPIDGLMMSLAMANGKGLRVAITQVTMVHALCAFVLWLLTFLG
jgi:hypothetical protein